MKYVVLLGVLTVILSLNVVPTQSNPVPQIGFGVGLIGPYSGYGGLGYGGYGGYGGGYGHGYGGYGGYRGYGGYGGYGHGYGYYRRRRPFFAPPAILVG
ncbi:keratin-associated protein 19-2-like [Anopheles merus]|uniref:keratin-associated protein 19-2-like n=1 Tax=Anopheles merus TaxID=30066 RepID=UPI001BE43092|nr:keratin-associated protein 19-2-like [Anopheles merus]